LCLGLTQTSPDQLISLQTEIWSLSAQGSFARGNCGAYSLLCSCDGDWPVALPFTGFPNATSGTYTNTFDLTTDLTGITLAAFLTGLESGMAYVNIHDATFPEGEIRGQLSQVVPEPSAIGILGLGVIAIFALTRRQRVY
jgi:hypothetical protein